MLFTSGCSLQGVLPFSVSFIFFIYWISFPFFFCIAFLPEADCCLSRITAATCCETNLLEYGQNFLMVKARLLTSTQTWTQTKDESSYLCPILMCKVWPGCTLAKYEHASQMHEHVNPICPTSFQHTPGMWVCGNLHQWEP